MKFKGINYKRITYLNENISYEKCPECSSEFSTGLVEDPDSIEYIKGLFRDMPNDAVKDMFLERDDGKFVIFICRKCFPGIAVED